MDIIFDIDDTLFDSSHRAHYYKKSQTNWEEFYRASLKDKPIYSSIAILKSLYQQGHTIILATGRREQARQLTISLLKSFEIKYDRLYMRPENDNHLNNACSKLNILKRIRSDGFNPTVAFEDNPLSVAMWRQAGLVVYHVNLAQSDRTTD